MSFDPFSLALSKLRRTINDCDSRSLHRWVLLKNSITHSPSQSHSSFSTIVQPEINAAHSNESDDGSFDSEGQWLDSLLEALDDDGDDDFTVDSEHQNSAQPTEDDEYHPSSPENSAYSPGTPDRGPSMFSGAQNPVINGGHFIASQSANIVIHANRPYRLNPQNILVSFLLTVPATFPAFHTPSDAQHHVEAKPPPFELVDPYQVYRPVQYEELPILLTPLMLLYLWRFAFGYQSAAAL